MYVSYDSLLISGLIEFYLSFTSASVDIRAYVCFTCPGLLLLQGRNSRPRLYLVYTELTIKAR